MKQPIIVVDLPTAPWQKVGTDFFHLNGKDFLPMIDYYSNYPKMALLSNTSANNIITHVKSIFARDGILQVVVSNNGPWFNCREFFRPIPL